MAVGRAERRRARKSVVENSFDPGDVEAALDLLELLEYAWHDCYGEPAPPDAVINDVLVVAAGDLAGLIAAARLAVIDRRDLRIAASQASGDRAEC